MVQGQIRYPGAGCVVEFMQGNAPQIAWVLEEQGGKLRLLLPNRRETSLQANRILPWAGPVYDGNKSRDAAIELLEKHRQKRETAVIDPVELWELAQGDVEQAQAQWFAELALNDPDMDAVAACGHALLNAKTHFKYNPPLFEVYPEAVVTARLTEQEATRKREELVNQGSAFVRRLWDVHLKKASAADPGELDTETQERLRYAIMNRIAEPETQEDDGLWRMLVKGLPDDPHLALHLATAWGLVGAHHNFWMDRAGYAPGDSWSQPYQEALATLVAAAEQDAKATPVPMSFISIDAPTTRDVDDSYHIEVRAEGGYRVTLALACPAAHWPFGSDLDKAVSRRATSIYLPEATHHMLPEALGIQTYSLLAGTVRPSMLVTCEIDAEGGLVTCEPAFGYVELAANLTYTDCEAALNGETNPASPYREQLEMALDLARLHQARRIRTGAVIIERPELQLILEGSGEDIQVHLEEEPAAPQAHLLVSELMVLANAALASWAKERGITLLHRTQDVAIPKEFAGIWSDPVDIARVVRALAPAVLETTPRPHAGLGEAVYAPSTSPLRRYPDLINQAQILHFLGEGTARWTQEELVSQLPLINARLDAAGQIQRTRPRYWKLLYFKQQGDKTWWRAMITDENDAFVTVNLPHEQLILRARRSFFGERTHPGQELEIRLGKIQPLQNEIQLVETREM